MQRQYKKYILLSFDIYSIKKMAKCHFLFILYIYNFDNQATLIYTN